MTIRLCFFARSSLLAGRMSIMSIISVKSQGDFSMWQCVKIEQKVRFGKIKEIMYCASEISFSKDQCKDREQGDGLWGHQN